ncbi:MAG: hypothetical protein AB1428_04540 [Bacteroidota bacterium]
MATMRWILTGCAFLALPLHAENLPSGPAQTRAGICLDLFGLPAAVAVNGDGMLPPTGGAADRKTPGLAAIYSLILPGMGEVYTGDFGSGKYFLIAEGVLWITYAAFEISGNALRDDARVFASAHASLMAPVKDDQLYVDVGNFNSLAEYNDKKLRDRDLSRVYDPALGYAWQWDAEASRHAFREERIRGETMYNNRKFVVAAILVNHVASAINAARAAIAQNAAQDDALGDLRLGAEILGSPAAPHGVMLTVQRSF